MTSTELTASQIDSLRRAAYDVDAELTTDYSGRGMYGRQCIGITTQNRAMDTVFRFAVALVHQDEDLANELAERHMVADEMGLGIIIYWPNVTADDTDG